MKTNRIITAIMLAFTAMVLPVFAQDTGDLDEEALKKFLPSKPPYSPYAGRNYPTRPFFGDTHVHTSYSMDAGAAGADGKLPPVGNTVDVAEATWTNTIGASELIKVWTDPDFDPAQKAFYYGRVIEIPTPRWTAYDAKYYEVKMSEEVTMTSQERAYTSPIWYTPAKK